MNVTMGQIVQGSSGTKSEPEVRTDLSLVVFPAGF